VHVQVSPTQPDADTLDSEAGRIFEASDPVTRSLESALDRADQYRCRPTAYPTSG
jgi:hypothetical protein